MITKASVKQELAECVRLGMLSKALAAKVLARCTEEVLAEANANGMRQVEFIDLRVELACI